MVDNAKFCPKCGAPNAAFSVPAGPPKPAPAPQSNERTKDIVAAVATGILALISFMPLLRLNVPLIGGSYSLLDLVNVYNQLNNYGYTAYGNISLAFFEGVVVWFVIIVTVWIAAIVASIVCVANVIRGKGSGGYGLVLLAVFGVLCTATVFVASSMLADAAGSYASSVSSMIVPTMWLWALTVGSFAGFITYYVSSKL